MNEIDRLQQAIQRARAAQDAEAVAELEGLLAQARTQTALQAPAFNAQQGFQLQPKSQGDIDRAQGRAVQQAERFWEDRQPGVMDRAGDLLGISGSAASGSIEAAPSGIAAATQLGSGEFLGQSRDTAQSMIRTDPGTVEGLTRTIEGISSPFSTLVGMFTPEQAPEQLKQAGQANLQETLAIRQKNAEEIAKLKQAYISEGGGEFAADLAQGVGGSLTSVAPLAGAAVVGGATRSPAAALIAQRTLSILPATQAYADSYAEYKAQYPEASEEDAQKYALSMAGIEYGVEAMLPTGAGALKGTGLRQVAAAVAGRTAQEGLTEGATEITSQVAQRELAPELAPQSRSEALYNVGLSTAAGSVLGGAINVAGVQAERVGLTRAQRVEQQRLAELAAQDETGKVAEGAALVQAIEDSVTKGTAAESPIGLVPQEPRGPSSPFLPRESGVDLETPRGDASTLLRPTEENLGEPLGPVSVLPGQDPASALGLDTPRGESSPLSESPVQQARVQELTQERDALFQKGTPLTRKQKSRVKTINRELESIASLQGTTQEAPVDRLARTQLPSLAEPATTQPAPTPLPTTRSERVSAPEAATVNSRVDPVEMAGPIVREDVVDTATGQVTGEQTVEQGVLPQDTRRQEIEAFFSAPRQEPLSSSDVLRAEESAALAPAGEDTPLVIPVEQRKPSQFEQRLSQATNARETVNIIRSYAKPGSPFARVLDALDQSPFLDNVAVKVFQPEDALPEGLKGENVRGVMQSFINGKMEVYLKGSGFQRSGTSTPEIALHEIVHVASVDLINGVNEKRITDPRARASVKRIDLLRQELAKSLDDGTLRSQLTGEEKSALDYATKNSKEFVSQALSSGAVQTGLKKEGLWTRFASAIRNLFSRNRQDTPLFEKIMDASLSVVQEQTRLAPEVREGRRQAEQEFLATRAQRMEANQAAPEDAAPSRREAGLPASRQAKAQPLRGTVNFTTVQGWRNGLGVSKDLFGDLFTGLMTSTRGVGTEVKVAERLREGAKQETDLIVEAFLNRVRSVIDKINPSEKSRKSINDRVMNYLRGNKAALDEVSGEVREVRAILGNKEFRDAIDSARSEIDNLTKRIGQEIVRAYQGRPMPEGMVKKLQTLKDGLGIYMTRVYEAFVDRKYGADLLQKYEAGDETARDVLKPLLDRLTDQTAFLGENLDNAERVAKLENDALEAQGRKPTQKPWSSANWEKVSDIKLETMYRDLIGSPAGLPREQMFNELRQWFNDNVGNAADKKQASQKTAMRIVRDILLTNSTNTPMAQFWRKMRTDDRALKDLEDVPTDVRKALGEVKDPFLRAAFTMSRQTAVVASLAQNNTLMEYSPQLFKPQAERIQGVHDFRIPNNPLAYGKLAGMFTDKNTHDFIVGSTEIYGADSLTELADLATKFRSGEDYVGAVGAYVLRKGMALSQMQKFAGIVFNHGAALLDYAGIPSFIVGRGNVDPGTLKSAVAVTKQLVGTQFRKKYSDETRRIMGLGIIDPALTRIDEQVDQAMRETELRQKLRKGTATYDVIKGFVTSAFNLIRDARAFAENIPKVANYLNNERFLRKAFPDLSQKEVERLAVEKTLRTEINYSMVPKMVRLTESLGVGYVVSFMWESYRTGFTNHTEAIREIRSGNPTMRQLGIQRLIGSTAGLAGMSYLYGTVLSGMVGALELDDEWDELMRYLGWHQQGQNRGILGISDDLTVTSADFGRMDGMDVYSATWRSVAQMLGQFAEGDDEGAIETAKATAEATASAFVGGAPLGTLAINTVAGRESKNFFEKEFPGLYDKFKASAGEVVGDSAATNVVDFLAAVTAAYTPGSGKQILRGVAASNRGEGTPTVLALAAGMPIAKDNPLATLEGFPARAFINTRREASSSIQDAVTIGTSKETPALMQSAVEDYISTQRDAYEELAKYANVARAAGRMVGKSEAELTKLIYESLKKNNGFPDEQADRLSKGLPFQPTMPSNQTTFLKSAIDRALGNQRQTTEVSRAAFAERRQQMEARKEQVLDLLEDRINSYKPEQQ